MSYGVQVLTPTDIYNVQNTYKVQFAGQCTVYFLNNKLFKFNTISHFETLKQTLYFIAIISKLCQENNLYFKDTITHSSNHQIVNLHLSKQLKDRYSCFHCVDSKYTAIMQYGPSIKESFSQHLYNIQM